MKTNANQKCRRAKAARTSQGDSHRSGKPRPQRLSAGKAAQEAAQQRQHRYPHGPLSGGNGANPGTPENRALTDLERLAAAAILHAPNTDRLPLLNAYCRVAVTIPGGQAGVMFREAAQEVWHATQMDCQQLRLNLILTEALEGGKGAA